MIDEVLPAASEVETPALKGEEKVSLKCDPKGPLVVYVFKTVADPFVGKLSYVKVVSGTLTADLVLNNARTGSQERQGKLIAKLDAPAQGTFVAPHIVRVKGIADLEREVFGPILHIATFEAEQLDKVVADINARGYGLTFGLHTRIDGRVQEMIDTVHVGNIYVNRNQIGAVVGSQPFGGEGLSGTGPKAGGPNYLHRFRKRASTAAGAPAGASVRVRNDQFADAVKSGWAGRHDRVAALRKVLRGKARAAMSVAAATEYGPVDLLGPTGEGNTLQLYSRGRVLCLGPDADTLMAQVVQALAAGNSVLAVANGAPRLLSGLIGKELPLQAVDGQVNPDDLAALNVDAVAFAGAGESLRALRQGLSRRSGAIIPVISEVFNPTAYAHERAVCVDTTAAGGNASLLAGSSEGGTGFSAASSGL